MVVSIQESSVQSESMNLFDKCRIEIYSVPENILQWKEN